MLALVVAACAFALREAFHYHVAMRRWASLRPRTWSSMQPQDAPPRERVLRELVMEVKTSADTALRRSLLNELTLEVNGALARRETAKLYWRVCVAAGVAGLLLTVWHHRLAGCVIAGTGVLAAAVAAQWSKSAERHRMAAKEHWRTFLDGLSALRNTAGSSSDSEGPGT